MPAAVPFANVNPLASARLHPRTTASGTKAETLESAALVASRWDSDDQASNPCFCNIDCTRPNRHSGRAVVWPCLLRRCSFLCRQILGGSRRKVGTRSRRRRCRNRNGASLSAWRQCADCKLGSEATGARPRNRAGARRAPTSRISRTSSGRAAGRTRARSARRPRTG